LEVPKDLPFAGLVLGLELAGWFLDNFIEGVMDHDIPTYHD
jgi:hypothetical protein